ncbi:MAG: hypothetical protein JJU28_08425 [Cyclobacteriaceae bacterium]|nr:hypothetical protein [Cyclobacteriaceae bacterium]
MIYVTEATKEDFDDVYGLLKLLNDTTIDQKTWGLVFSDVFKTGASPGYLLKDDEKTVGFFGTVFSNRIIDGEEFRFCNCHSWIVDEKYRSKGLLLLSKIHKLKNHILTIFSASSETFQIYKQLKWKEIDNSASVFWGQPLRFLVNGNIQVYQDNQNLEGISESGIKIAEDHKTFQCKINTLRKPAGSALQVFKEVPYFPAKLIWLQKILPFQLKLGHFHYTSDPGLFFTDFKQNIQAICKKENWLGVIIPNRYIKKYGLTEGRKYYKKRSILYKSDIEIDPVLMDMLYSEVFILDLK